MGKKKEFFGKQQTIMTRIFGCWHPRVSKLMTIDNVTFRCCLKCGMRKNYDPETFESRGAFYSPPIRRESQFV